MNKEQAFSNAGNPTLPKSLTGIKGLDEITQGGLPEARPTLICGPAGCGKTLFSMEFLVHGAREFGEPGVFMAFEEKAEELEQNVRSLGFDLADLQARKLMRLDHVHIERSEIEETGEYDLDGLFIRLGHAIDTIGAKRVVLDTLESLFSGLNNQGIIRAELRRLFEWLKEKKVTTVITAEKGDGMLTRHGLEEYVSDCVIMLDHRISNKISTRLLRIVKYRGSVHGTNEYPFLIEDDGISVIPVTSLTLSHDASTERISSGIPALDKMLGGKGFFRGSSILVSGTAGTGKTSIAASFAYNACQNNKRCIYFAFEESPQQIIRNTTSIGFNMQQYVDEGLLIFHASRPTVNGLEFHLLSITRLVNEFNPAVVVIDPITNLITIGSVSEVKSVLIRLIDFLQSRNITVMFTALALKDSVTEQSDESISSLVDAWLLVRDIEFNGERNRGMYVMKSRGMKHSNQIREFVISDSGLDLIELFIGPEGVLTGSAREAQQLIERSGDLLRDQAILRKDREIQRKKTVLDSKIASLQEEFESIREELNKNFIEEQLKKDFLEQNRQEVIKKRDGLE